MNVQVHRSPELFQFHNSQTISETPETQPLYKSHQKQSNPDRYQTPVGKQHMSYPSYDQNIA